MIKKYNNLVEPLLDHVNYNPTRPFLFYKKNGVYESILYKEVYESVENIALSLKELGITENNNIALMSNNRPEWVISDMAILSLKCVTVPIYPTLAANDIAYILHDSNSKIIIVETQEMLDQILSIKHQCPDLAHIIIIDHPNKKTESTCHEFIELYTAQKMKNQDEARYRYKNQIDTIKPDHLASIVYTSGTTGTPKGVMLTHNNIIENIKGVMGIQEIGETDSSLSFLPLSHIFERTCGYYGLLIVGAKIYYAESIQTVAQDMLLAQPTILISVPRLYEKIYTKITSNLSGIKKVLFTWALKVGKVHYDHRDDKQYPFFHRIQHKIAHALVYKKVAKKTGGRIRFFISGGAPLSSVVAEFFESLGLVVIEGYGLTETSPILTCNSPSKRRIGTVGQPLPNVQIKLSESNELLAKGPSIMKGYYNLDEKTKEAFTEDGWFKTGDVAEIDPDGYIKIIDRQKEIIVLSNGKNVAPLKIEELLKIHPFIAQPIVIGEKHNYITALIVPDFEQLQNNPTYKDRSPEDIINDPETEHAFKAIIDNALLTCSNYEKVKKFKLLSTELTQESGELTPTLKYKRAIIREKYKAEISALYGENKI